MTTSPLFVGVDVAKERLGVAVRPSGERWSVATDEAGVAALVARLRPLAPALIVCEATGGFERAAIVALAAAGLPVVVANPRQVRDFARATIPFQAAAAPRQLKRWLGVKKQCRCTFRLLVSTLPPVPSS